MKHEARTLTGGMHGEECNGRRNGRRPRASDKASGGRRRPRRELDGPRTGLRSWAVLALAAAAACGGAPPEEAASDPAPAAAPPPYHVYVTNEYSGDLTVIAGGTNEVVATVPLGKRPRGIRVSPDGTQLFVALSGSPPAPPGVDESTLPPPDRSADGIGVIDRAAGVVVQVVQAGTDPEQVAVSADGTRLYVANEDAREVSVVDIATGEVVAALPVGGEPEGVRISPDGSVVYVTSEEDNQVSAIDTATNEVVARFEVGARPRASAFAPDGSRAYVTAENGGTVHVVDTSTHEVVHTIELTGELVRADGRRRLARRLACLRDDRAGPDGRRDRRGYERAGRLRGGGHAAVGHRRHAGRPISLYGERPLERRQRRRHRIDDRRRHRAGRRAAVGHSHRRRVNGTDEPPVSEPDLGITLGIEEEFFLVDPESRDLVSDPLPAIFEACQHGCGPHRVVHEAIRSQIETNTRVCGSVAEVRAALRETRRIVVDTAARFGVAVMAASSHPFARWQAQLVTPRERYERFAVTFQESLRRLVVGGMHVHAGFGDPDSRIRVMTALRRHLPLLHALSASSPFRGGHETGFKSYRLSIMGVMPPH